MFEISPQKSSKNHLLTMITSFLDSTSSWMRIWNIRCQQSFSAIWHSFMSLCVIVKGQLTQDLLNLDGFHLPETTFYQRNWNTVKKNWQRDIVLWSSTVWFFISSWRGKKQKRLLRMNNQEDYLETMILQLMMWEFWSGIRMRRHKVVD